MATINVKDAAGSTVALEKPLTPGQAAMAASRPVVIASDQSAVPVSLASVPSHAVTNAGTFAVQVSSAPTTAVTQSGTWTVQPGNTANTTAWKVDGSAVTQPVSGTVTANQGSANATPWNAKVTDGTNAAAIKAASTAPVASDPALVVALSPNSSGIIQSSTGLRVASAASTNATSVKTSAGSLAEVDLYNTAAYTVFVKFYNKASSPTVGTDTPVWTVPIAAGGGYSKSFVRGKAFATGIAYAITKLQADSDTTAVVAGDVTGSIEYV